MMMAARSGERGAATAELAVVLPLFLLATLAVVDVGRAMWTKNTIANIAREGSRYASVRSNNSQDPVTAAMVDAQVQGYAATLDPEKLSVTTTWTPSNSPGSVVHIDVTYSFEPVVPLLFFESLELTSSSEMIISY